MPTDLGNIDEDETFSDELTVSDITDENRSFNGSNIKPISTLRPGVLNDIVSKISPKSKEAKKRSKRFMHLDSIEISKVDEMNDKVSKVRDSFDQLLDK